MFPGLMLAYWHREAAQFKIVVMDDDLSWVRLHPSTNSHRDSLPSKGFGCKRRDLSLESWVGYYLFKYGPYFPRGRSFVVGSKVPDHDGMN